MGCDRKEERGRLRQKKILKEEEKERNAAYTDKKKYVACSLNILKSQEQTKFEKPTVQQKEKKLIVWNRWNNTAANVCVRLYVSVCVL